MAIIVDLNPKILSGDLPLGDVGLSDLPGPTSADISVNVGICDSCQHWRCFEGVSKSLMQQMNGAVGECHVEDRRVTVVGVGYGSDGGAAFVTRCDFGCVCHSPRLMDTKVDQ